MISPGFMFRACSVALAGLLSACGGGGGTAVSGAASAAPAPEPPAAIQTTISAVVLSELGRQIFNDKSLSASGKIACSSCHDPAFGHASNPLFGATVRGGADGLQPGLRNVPTLGYLRFASSLRVNVAENEIVGGLNWDGSANSFLEQAQRPFLSVHEMANVTPAALMEKLKAAPYAPQFISQFGKDIFSNAAKALEAAAAAVGEFQSVDPVFAPFDSKFDAVQAGKASFTVQEARGLAWFNDPGKGNCASCHSPNPISPFIPALFTDAGYDNIGVPRNNNIAANADPTRFDLGLCTNILGTRIDLSSTCGAFKAPTLRNVAKTAPYFHNGKFATLQEVIEFYVTRDITPERWYPIVDGVVNKYDDVPVRYKANVNVSVAPYDRSLGDTPALTPAEIQDIVVFLSTLNDGWRPPVAAVGAGKTR